MMTRKPLLSLSLQRVCDFKELPSRSVMYRWMQRALERDAMITVRFVGEKEGHALNKQYRGIDRATNVLTFDYAHEPVAQADLVICVPVLHKECEQQNKGFKEHLAHLLIHGVLHAQGYDHANERQAKKMEQTETDILVSLGFLPPYPDRNYKPRTRK